MKNIFSSRPLNPQLLISLLTSLVCAVSLEAKVHETHVKESKDSSTSHSKEKECRECDFVITAKDIGCDGVVLCKSGYHCLCEDAVFNPKANQNAAIRISTSNVTLDLRGRTLSQKSKDVLGVDGILVDPGLTNIIIKNGTIKDFSDAGIRAGALSEPLITELSISDIQAFNNALSTTIADPNFRGEGIGGVVIFNAQDVKINNCTFNTNAFAGLWSFNITKFTMENCHCDDNTAANFFAPNTQLVIGGTVAGISTDIRISHCTFNRNTSGGEALGFGLDFAFGTNASTNIVLDACQFNDNTAIVSDPAIALALEGSSEAAGTAFVRATNLTLQNCEANGNSLTLNVPLTSGFPPVNEGLVNLVFGFQVANSNNVTITNCSSSGNKFQNNSGVGVRNVTESFSISNGTNKVYMSNCHADGNSNGYNADSDPLNVPSLLIVEGFDFSLSGNIVVEDCTASGHNQAAANPAEGQFSISAGFNAHFFACGACGPIIFRRCSAIGNVDTGTLGGLAFGFSTREPEFAGTLTGPNSGPYIFESCIAEGSTNGSGTGSGFDIFNLVDSQIINCIANSNNIGINVLDFTLGGGTTFGSKNNLLRGNVVSANTIFGIQDLSAAKNNAYYANQAKNNGLTPATTNYRGTGIFPAATCNTALCIAPGANLTPLLYWNLPQAPCATNTNCVTSTPLDNLSIVN